MLKIFGNPLLRQYAVVILVSLCMMATGVGIMWSSPVLVKLADSEQTVLPGPITDEEGSWIASIGLLGSMGSNILIGAFLVEKLGRKYCLILVCLPKLVAGFLLLYASKVWMLLLGRGLFGIGDAGVFIILPMYASEIASKEIRGSLGTIIQIMCSIGVVIMLSVGPFVSYWTLHVVFTCLIVCTTVPLIILPESPYCLYSRGKKSEALKVLTFFRASESIAAEELKEYEMAVDKNSKKISKKDIITNRLFQKSLFLILVLAVGTQFVGYIAVAFYLQTILESTATSVRPEIASLIIGLIQLFASFCTTVLTDRFGRKPILIVTGLGMGMGMFGLSLFFRLKEADLTDGFMNYVPLISLILVVFCYCAGCGSLMYVLNSELLDDPSRGLGVSMGQLTSTLCMFLIAKYFAVVSTAIGPYMTYGIFSVNCILFSLFVLFCVPETKRRSFAEIQDILGKRNFVSFKF